MSTPPIPQPPTQPAFDPVAEARKQYPGLQQWPDARILANLTDPQKFRSTFPQYGGLDDQTIIRNMQSTLRQHITQQSATYDSNPTVNGSETRQYLTNAGQILGVLPPDAQSIQTGLKTLGGDISGFAKSMLPSSTNPLDVANYVANPVATIGKNMIAGDIQGRTDRAMQSTQLQQQGETTNSALQRLAASIPGLGPMLIPSKQDALQPGAAGLGQARIGELLASEAVPRVVGGLKGAPIAPETALDAALPPKSGIDTAAEVTAPATPALRQTFANMKASGELAPDALKGAKATNTAVAVVDRAVADNRALFHRYLDPVAGIKEPLPSAEPAVVQELVSDFEKTNPQLAERVKSGQTTLSDLDQLRQEANRISEPTYASTKNYSPTMVQSIKGYGAALRDSLYGRLEALHQLPPDALRNVKMQEGALLQIQPLINKMNANVSGLNTAEVARSVPQKVAGAIGQVRSYLNPESALAQVKLGLGQVGDTARLLRQTFKNPPLPQVPGAGMPAPQEIVPRSSYPYPLQEGINKAIQQSNMSRPSYGGEQALTGRRYTPSATPAFPEMLQTNTSPFEGALPQSTARGVQSIPSSSGGYVPLPSHLRYLLGLDQVPEVTTPQYGGPQAPSGNAPYSGGTPAVPMDMQSLLRDNSPMFGNELQPLQKAVRRARTRR